jgi:hypothetical protein
MRVFLYHCKFLCVSTWSFEHRKINLIAEKLHEHTAILHASNLSLKYTCVITYKHTSIYSHTKRFGFGRRGIVQILFTNSLIYLPFKKKKHSSVSLTTVEVFSGETLLPVSFATVSQKLPWRVINPLFIYPVE